MDNACSLVVDCQSEERRASTRHKTLVRDYGFKNVGLRRLISIIESENGASIRVAEKMGMTLEKSASFHNIPVLIYSVANAMTGTA